MAIAPVVVLVASRRPLRMEIASGERRLRPPRALRAAPVLAGVVSGLTMTATWVDPALPTLFSLLAFGLTCLGAFMTPSSIRVDEDGLTLRRRTIAWSSVHARPRAQDDALELELPARIVRVRAADANEVESRFGRRDVAAGPVRSF